MPFERPCEFELQKYVFFVVLHYLVRQSAGVRILFKSVFFLIYFNMCGLNKVKSPIDIL